MRPVKLRENIYWVGAIDWDLRNFHGYLTQRGSTYNAYLIIDEKVTLIDNVKHQLYGQMIARISEIIDPKKIDYIIQNHVEMDHSGSLPMLMDLIPQATVFTSPKGEEGLKLHFKKEWKFETIKTGDTISIGKRSLSFVLTPMVHWPDNMITYCPEDKILFSNDAFGQHIASNERTDREMPLSIIMEEARKYYANIVLPYGKQVQKALAALQDTPIDYICPSHGIVWTDHITDIVAEYSKWSSNVTEKRAIVVYDSMWKSTEKIAYALQDIFQQKNIPTLMCNLQVNHISDIMTEILSAKYICVGSPTLNNNILPTVSAFLTYLKGLAPKSRIGLAFGSYGWSGQSIDIIHNTLRECGFDMLDSIKIRYIPEKKDFTVMKKSLFNQI